MKNYFLFLVAIYLKFLTCIFAQSFNESFLNSENFVNQTVHEQNCTVYPSDTRNSSTVIEEFRKARLMNNESFEFELDSKMAAENDLENWNKSILQLQNSSKVEEVNASSTHDGAFNANIEFNGSTVIGNGSDTFNESFKNPSDDVEDSNNTLLRTNSNETELKECVLINDSKCCNENNFSGSLHCKREAENRISCYLNNNETEVDLRQNLERIHVSITSRKDIAQYPTKNALCDIRVTGDISFYALHNYTANSVSELRHIIEKVNEILSSTDFNEDGEQDNLTLRIQDVFMKKATNISGGYNHSHNFTKLLHEFKEIPQNSCMSLLFVAIPDDSDFISTAYTNGVCKHSWNKPNRSRNIGLINVVNSQGCKRSNFAIAWTAAMTVGHIMGSADKLCDPMLPFPPEQWTSFFSDCGRRNIASLLLTQGSCLRYPENDKYLPIERSTSKAMQKVVLKPTCGNGRVDPGEECDCGTKERCRSMYSCCAPPGSKNECHYDRSRGFECDWTEPCCAVNCKIIPKSWDLFCGIGDPSCVRHGAYCDGKSSHCPVSKLVENLSSGDMCGPGTSKQLGAGTCQHGRCNSTVCRDAGLEDCMCGHSTKQECRVCCRHSFGQQKYRPCIPAEHFGLNSKDTKFFYRYPGTPCNKVRLKYCDKNGNCKRYSSTLSRSAGADSTLSRSAGSTPKYCKQYWCLLICCWLYRAVYISFNFHFVK